MPSNSAQGEVEMPIGLTSNEPDQSTVNLSTFDAPHASRDSCPVAVSLTLNNPCPEDSIPTEAASVVVDGGTQLQVAGDNDDDAMVWRSVDELENLMSDDESSTEDECLTDVQEELLGGLRHWVAENTVGVNATSSLLKTLKPIMAKFAIHLPATYVTLMGTPRRIDILQKSGTRTNLQHISFSCILNSPSAVDLAHLNV
jgi:hypothetical protein